MEPDSSRIGPEGVCLLQGDAAEVLRAWDSSSVDSVVTDPPSGTNMMVPFQKSDDPTRYSTFDSPLGKSRSGFKTLHRFNMRFRACFQQSVWPVLSEASRLLKPGGYGVFWTLQRSSHWLSWGLEEAGMSITDLIIREVPTRRLKSPFVDQKYSTQVLQETEVWVLARKPGSETSASKNQNKWGTGYMTILGDDGGKLTHLFKRDHGRAPTKKVTTHPNEKCIEWMRTLVRLVTPSGGLVLDPFMGSGTTGAAALLEGRQFVGVERDPQRFDEAAQRLQKASEKFPWEP